MEKKNINANKVNEFAETLSLLLDILDEAGLVDDDDDDCDCDGYDCGYCDDYDCEKRNVRDDDGEGDEDDDTVYRLTEKAIMMLVLKDFGIDVSLEKADKIYKALVNDLDKAGYVKYVPNDEDD